MVPKKTLLQRAEITIIYRINIMKFKAILLTAMLTGCSSANFNVRCSSPTLCNINVPEHSTVHLTEKTISIEYAGKAIQREL